MVSLVGLGCGSSEAPTSFDPIRLSDGTLVEAVGACDSDLSQCWTIDGQPAVEVAEQLLGRTEALANAIGGALGATTTDSGSGSVVWVRAKVPDASDLPSFLFVSEAGESEVPGFVYAGFSEGNLVLTGYRLGPACVRAF